ncbi:putative gluconate 5-dehydrogenase protein [Botrytis fragariae]|uniref:Short-chain dehydrogenase/reductase ABA4 n=1 Tax=Botrytis fragariae TaxID=1964551 RepID=A0A8H6ECF4_9HELO|nr:putative gluconate 5-dehydrogenase protein [Botrytis fragariae]KAF5867451.1 putative gluconate 5-dehydrogenase protein [Botrytis fragariae]
MTSFNLPPNISLEGKAAIVTGGSRGIGAGIALELAKRGAKVAIVYQSDKSTPLAQKVASQISELGSVTCLVQVDLATLDAGRRVIDQALKGLNVSKIDILVNNAASYPPFLPVLELDGALFDHEYMVNVRAPHLLVQALLSHLVEKDGRVINISSGVSRIGVSNLSLYASTKAALECLGRQWAHELACPYKMTVNNLALGEIDTAVEGGDIPDKFRDAQVDGPSAAKRHGSIGEVANVVAFLASSGASWINGNTISVSGGHLYI